MGKTTVGSKIDGRKKAKLIEKADGNGKNVNQVLEELIDKYLGDELKPEETAEAKNFAPVLSELRGFKKDFEEAQGAMANDMRELFDRTRKTLEVLEEFKESPSVVVEEEPKEKPETVIGGVNEEDEEIEEEEVTEEVEKPKKMEILEIDTESDFFRELVFNTGLSTEEALNELLRGYNDGARKVDVEGNFE